jgi:hypothetical protein
MTSKQMNAIKLALGTVIIKKRGTKAGDKQRKQFKFRWLIGLDDLRS